jgi:hypothetical protein
VSDEGTPSPTLRFFMGIAFAAAGIFPILAALDIGPFESSAIHGPPWIGVAVGAAFIGGALFLWFQEAATRHAWLGHLFALLIVAALAALANWIAFGPGPRECTGTFSFAMFTSARWAAGLDCRIAFGIGGMMCNGLLVVIAGKGLAQAGVTGGLPKLLEKIGAGMIVVAFAPLLLIFVVFKLVEQGAKWCWSRATGRTTQA